jgi:hypothetical protein
MTMSKSPRRQYTRNEIRASRVFALFATGGLGIFWGWRALDWPLHGYLHGVTRFGSMFGDDRVFPHQHVVFELTVLETFGALAFSIWAFFFFLRIRPGPPGGSKDSKGTT